MKQKNCPTESSSGLLKTKSHQAQKSISEIHHIKRLRKKNHTIISIDAQKPGDKTQQSFMIKTLSKLEIEGNFLNWIKDICKNVQLTLFLIMRN